MVAESLVDAERLADPDAGLLLVRAAVGQLGEADERRSPMLLSSPESAARARSNHPRLSGKNPWCTHDDVQADAHAQGELDPIGRDHAVHRFERPE